MGMRLRLHVYKKRKNERLGSRTDRVGKLCAANSCCTATLLKISRYWGLSGLASSGAESKMANPNGMEPDRHMR